MDEQIERKKESVLTCNAVAFSEQTGLSVRVCNAIKHFAKDWTVERVYEEGLMIKNLGKKSWGEFKEMVDEVLLSIQSRAMDKISQDYDGTTMKVEHPGLGEVKITLKDLGYLMYDFIADQRGWHEQEPVTGLSMLERAFSQANVHTNRPFNNEGELFIEVAKQVEARTGVNLEYCGSNNWLGSDKVFHKFVYGTSGEGYYRIDQNIVEITLELYLDVIEYMETLKKKEAKEKQQRYAELLAREYPDREVFLPDEMPTELMSKINDLALPFFNDVIETQAVLKMGYTYFTEFVRKEVDRVFVNVPVLRTQYGDLFLVELIKSPDTLEIIPFNKESHG